MLNRLKPQLLPAWNAAHHRGRRLVEIASALAAGRVKRCTVCGRVGPMLLRPRAIPERLRELWGLSPRLAAALVRKESLDCPWCGAKLRARRLAATLLEVEPRPSARSVRDWVRDPASQALRVAEINLVDGLHVELARLPGLAYSEYLEGVEPGSTREGVRCEDLRRLTYPDASFDLVLTSETLEHVLDLDAALAEIGRILRPGGRHLCTVPAMPHVPRTFARRVIGPDGAVEDRAPRLCHPGGDVGYPVFTEIGRDFPDRLRATGFEVEVRFGPLSEDDLAQVYVCRKPAG